jgi:hypothetical protein
MCANQLVHNPNCDGSHCSFATGRVVVLPLPGVANLILCHSCYEHEMRWRRERNEKLAVENRYDLPEWDALKVYGNE